MKIRTKLLTIASSILMGALFLTGCGTTKITKEDSGKMFYNIAIHQDDAELKNLLGDEASEFDSLMSEQIDDAKQSAQKMLTSSEFNLSEDKVNKFMDALLVCIRSQECKNVTVDSEDGDKATLTLEVTTADINALANELVQDLQKDLQAKVSSGNYSYSNMKEIQNEFMNDYFSAITDKLNNYGVGTQTKTITYNFEKKEFKNGTSNIEVWVPENANKFGKELGNLTIGQ